MIIDVNVSLSRWPFRRVYGDDTPTLVSHLRARGVVQAWAGSFDALLHRDIAAVNERLADDCRRYGAGGFLVPFGVVNPSLPDWEEDLRRCHEQHRMPGIRLLPNYHSYKLDNPSFAHLLEGAHKRGLIVQIATKQEDERTHHPLMGVPEVDLKPLLSLKTPRPPIVILNGLRSLHDEPLRKLAALGSIWFDIAMIERVGSLGERMEQTGKERMLFGSHFPFFYWEPAQLKVKEAGLDPTSEKALLSDNARALLAATRTSAKR